MTITNILSIKKIKKMMTQVNSFNVSISERNNDDNVVINDDDAIWRVNIHCNQCNDFNIEGNLDDDSMCCNICLMPTITKPICCGNNKICIACQHNISRRENNPDKVKCPYCRTFVDNIYSNEISKYIIPVVLSSILDSAINNANNDDDDNYDDYNYDDNYDDYDDNYDDYDDYDRYGNDDNNRYDSNIDSVDEYKEYIDYINKLAGTIYNVYDNNTYNKLVQKINLLHQIKSAIITRNTEFIYDNYDSKIIYYNNDINIQCYSCNICGDYNLSYDDKRIHMKCICAVIDYFY